MHIRINDCIDVNGLHLIQLGRFVAYDACHLFDAARERGEHVTFFESYRGEDGELYLRLGNREFRWYPKESPEIA